MISAIRRYDPDREVPMAAYISISLQYEILNIKRRHKPHGMTGVRQDTRLDYVYLDGILSDANLAGLSSNDDHAAVELSELLEGLSDTEAEALGMSIRGHRIRSKAHAAALERVRRKYAGLYSAAY
jgi:2-hydroxychromene-2-carboxylate isomerase